MPAAGAEVADAEIGNAAQAFHLFPEPRLGAGVENVEFELAQMLERGARLQFADLGERVDLPHRRSRPEALEAELQLAVADGELIVGEPEIVLQPIEEGRLEDAAAAEEAVAGEPDQFGLAETQLARGFKLLAQLCEADDFAQAHRRGAIDERECGAGAGEMLPDELEHEELVEIGVEQGARDGIHLPVVIVRAAGEVDNHGKDSLQFAVHSSQSQRRYCEQICHEVRTAN